ncbi:MAG TPA: carboxymuconolactone decarboxylase family protein [Burkholderiales bacterium]|nr:carboxymuconolactone decarboxylase family protein [Burkholderiales bacterium]
MSKSEPAPELELTPEAVLARATKARGDIFPEWRPLAHASPKTYHLVNETVSYLHHYDGQEKASDCLSRPMRELIAIPALCAKSDLRHAPNHVRRAYRIGLTNKALFEAASAFASVVGWGGGLTFMSLAIMEANNPFYAFGQLPPGGEPDELTPFPEMYIGRQAKRSTANSLAATPEWQYIAQIDGELAKRTAAFIDHCLLAEDATDEILGPGPRELIAVAALCTRGAVDIAADHIRHAYDCGMSKRQVLEAICCVIPMTGMLSAQYGARAMKLADEAKRS